MVTIKQIAEELGISPTTVSNVINGRTEKMSPQTKARIQEALTRNHYEVMTRSNPGSAEDNAVAAAFYMSDMGNVLMDPFCGELLGAIEEELKVLGRRLIYSVPESEDEILRLYQPWNVEGGILLGCIPETCAALQRKVPKPLVFIDSCFDESGGYYNVGLQDYEGACELTSYLIKLGHRTIAFFCPQNPPLASNLERYRGFRDTMQRSGLEFGERDFYYLPPSQNLRHEALRQFVRKHGKEYSAAFFISDFQANDAINVFFSQGVRVPEDISVTGFDDNIYAKLSRPTLTTVRQSPAVKAKMAVRMLMQRIRGEEIMLPTIQLPTELIVRESVRNMAR